MARLKIMMSMDKKTILKTMVAVAITLGLSACGGGGGGSSSGGTAHSGSSAVDDNFVISNLKSGNATNGYSDGGDFNSSWDKWADGTAPEPCNNNYCHEDINQPAVENVLHRYRVFADSAEDELIPVYLQGFDSDNRITQAIQEIETVVGFKMFKTPQRVDIKGVEEGWANVLYNNGEYMRALKSKGGLIFSLGMTENFGHVAMHPAAVSPPGHTLDSDGYYTFDEPLWVNLDNYEKGNIATVEIAAHEISHALGMYKHFESFGADGTPPFGNGGKAVLKTMYNNDAGLDFNNLTVYK